MNSAGRWTRAPGVFAVIAAFLFVFGFLATSRRVLGQAQSPPSDSISYQGIFLEPGDVIDFRGGIFTVSGVLVYGHTALYLGRDKETGKPTFLDFTTAKHKLKGDYFGRILDEETFLLANSKSHTSFDVFRLKDRTTLSKEELFASAKRIAKVGYWGPFGAYCSEAVARVLSDSTRSTLKIGAPDEYAASPLFQRPGGVTKSITMEGAIHAMRERSLGWAPTTRSEFADMDDWLNKREFLVSESQKRRDKEDREEAAADAASSKQMRWNGIDEWTSLACQYFDLVAKDPMRKQGEADAVIRNYLLTHLVVLPKDELSEGLALNSHLTSCQKEIMRLILDAPGPIEASWLVQKMDPEGPPGRVGQAFLRFVTEVRKALETGAVVIVTAVALPVVTVVAIDQYIDSMPTPNHAEPSGEGSGHRGEGDGYHHGNSVSESDSEAYRQLRGIASDPSKWN